MRELEAIRYHFKVSHWYHLEPLSCCGALFLLTCLLNLEVINTIGIVNCVNIIREDELLAVLVGDQGNHLIAQLGQESGGIVCYSQLDSRCRRRKITDRINVVRFLETSPDVWSSQVVSSGQKMM